MISLRMGRLYVGVEPPGAARDGTQDMHDWRIPVFDMKVYYPEVDLESEMRVSPEGKDCM
jgi:hypothetical protein